jgi:hypothetical protein
MADDISTRLPLGVLRSVAYGGKQAEELKVDTQTGYTIFVTSRDSNENSDGGKQMNGKRVLGLVLLALGVLALAYQGFTYTTQKKVVDIGPIQATKSEHHTVPLPPVIGVIAVIAGIVILATDRSS